MNKKGCRFRCALRALCGKRVSLAPHYLFDKRSDLSVSHFNRNLMAVLRIDNYSRFSTGRVDCISQPSGLLRVGAVILRAVDDQRSSFYILRRVEERAFLQRSLASICFALHGM